MRIMILLTLLSATAFAQDQSAIVKAACGPQNVNFSVKQDDSQHTPAQPPPGKALIYFVQKVGTPWVMKIGINGAWVGALKESSYFSVSADPGEQHVCMNLQSRTSLGQFMTFAHLTVEAGKVYYLGTDTTVIGPTIRLEIEPMDSDEAKYLIASTPLSASQPKK